MIVDRQGRRFRNLRISLTSACNYACTYCVPDGKRLVAAQDELSAEAMARGVAYLIEAAGIERLLGIAGGSLPDDLASVARRFGQPEAHVREAARFYAREVLFFPQADAYRVLGVEADATPAQIKVHHRLLQHWLHPDRLQGEDDEIFATRVNAAWSQLRSVERRRAVRSASAFSVRRRRLVGVAQMTSQPGPAAGRKMLLVAASKVPSAHR